MGRRIKRSRYRRRLQSIVRWVALVLLGICLCSLSVNSQQAIAQAPASVNSAAVDETPEGNSGADIDGINREAFGRKDDDPKRRDDSETGDRSDSEIDEPDEPVCTLSSHSVRIDKYNKTLFCIEAWFQDEPPQARVSRVQEQIEDVVSGRINLQSLGLRQGSDLDAIVTSSATDIEDEPQGDRQLVGLVSNMSSLRGRDRLIFLVTPLDVDMQRDGESQTVSTVSLAIAQFAAVQQAIEQVSEEKAWVTFDWGPYWPWRWRRSEIDILEKAEDTWIGPPDQERLFPVQAPNDSEDFYNAAYRGITITRRISELANRVLSAPPQIEAKRSNRFSQSSDFAPCTVPVNVNDSSAPEAIPTALMADDTSLMLLFCDDFRQAIADLDLPKEAAIAPHPLAELYRDEIQNRIVRYQTLYQLNAALVLLILVTGSIVSWGLSRETALVTGSARASRSPMFWPAVLITGGVALLCASFLPPFPRRNAVNALLNALGSRWAAFVAYLQEDFFQLATIVVITVIVLSLLRRGIRFIPGTEARRRMVFYGFGLVIVAFAAVVASPHLPGAGTAYLAGVSAFAVLAFSLSAQAAIGDVIAGFVLVFLTDLEKGHWVCIGPVTGHLVEQNLFVHEVQTAKNVVVTLRNSTVLSSLISNFSAAKKDRSIAPLILHTTVTLGYDVPWRKVHRVLLRAARKTTGLRHMPPPFILQTSLDDYYVSYELNAHTDEVTKLPRLYSHLHENIQDECNRAGIEILSPHYRAVRDGSEITIPVEDQGGEPSPHNPSG